MSGRTFVAILFFWAVLTILTPTLVRLSASAKANLDLNGEKREEMNAKSMMGLLPRRALVAVNLPLLFQLFHADVVHAIWSISFSLRGCVDRQVWAFTNHGNFSVKSAYHVAFSLSDHPVNRSFVNPKCLTFIWKCQCLPKVKYFLWQCVHGVLPTLAALKHRGLSEEDCCSFCGEDPETLEHLLFRCSMSIQVWKLSPLRLDCRSWGIHSFDEWWITVCNQGVDLIVSSVVSAFWEFRDANQFPQLSYRHCSPMLLSNYVVWSPSEAGSIKCNMDATFLASKRWAGGGLVFKGHSGVVLRVVMLRSFLASLALSVEAFVIKDALFWARDFGFHNLCLENDSLILCEVVMGIRPYPTAITVLVHNIQLLLKSVLVARVTHVRRAANSLAHEITMLSRSYPFNNQVFYGLPW
ncbi:uncharacterized protein LOC132277822 [Cornus florida]|uniref:uncharacterized protein LOC132277822 n=1 Tax=Cornus florida TaxID=4283 RepID=UPI002899A08F|nr:uncharacterized protein LOC132277822 [Cornus florida]